MCQLHRTGNPTNRHCLSSCKGQQRLHLYLPLFRFIHRCMAD
uniref:Uncharacterized protein n=1 Tax=Rhizophora mucronata TaxID=61149 RepID=A0A2P2Q1P8_RHIMU